MITITRRQAHDLRAVFRRSALGVAHRGALPPLVLEARGGELCLKHRHEALAIARTLPGRCEAEETVLLPLDALGDVEGRVDTPVTLEAAGPGRTLVRWEDRHVPQTREYAVPASEALAAFPASPESWSGAQAGLIGALAAAAATCADSEVRYALGSVQLRGRTGEVVATDGRQLLVQGGFTFPWSDDVLVRRSTVFASPALPQDEPVTVGRTDTHVALRAGPWTLFLEVRQGARYPDVADVVPEVKSAATRLCIDDGDAAFLAEALGGLPGADEPFRPLALDLNGRVALRARGGDPLQVTEVVLSRSRCTGQPLRLNSDRQLLARALTLGFRELEVRDAQSPVAARDARRVYVWQPLDHESAVGPDDDVTRIESCPDTPGIAVQAGPPLKARHDMRGRTNLTNSATENSATPAGEAHSPPSSGLAETSGAADGPVAAGLTSVIREAEALHQALADAKRRTARLIAALRRQKKRDRLVASTLTALKELKLQEVNG